MQGGVANLAKSIESRIIPGSYRLNVLHPSAPGLTLCTVANPAGMMMGLSRSGINGSLLSGAKFVQDPMMGSTLETVSGTSDAVSFPGIDRILGTTENTILVRWCRQGAAAASSMLIATHNPGGPTSSYLGVSLGWNNDSVTSLDVGGNAVGATRVSASLNYGMNVWNTLCCTHGPRGMEIWLNGVLVASSAATPSRATGGTGDALRIGASTIFSNIAYTADNLRYSHICVWNRQLSRGEASALSADPNGLVITPNNLWMMDSHSVRIVNVSAAIPGVAAVGVGGITSISRSATLTGVGTVAASGQGYSRGGADLTARAVVSLQSSGLPGVLNIVNYLARRDATRIRGGRA